MTYSLAKARDALMGSLFADTAAAEKPRMGFALDMLSDWLPYRVYDESAGLYRNARSKGFILEVTPLIGADERTGEILGQFFSEGLPEGACLQVLNFASPRIGQVVSPWFAPRYERGGVYEAIARERIARFYDLVWESGSAHAPFHVRSTRLIVSLGLPEGSKVSDAELSECREGLLGLIHSLGLEAHALWPSALIGLVDELTSPTTAREPEPSHWNPLEQIDAQAIRRDIELEVEDDRLVLRTERFREVGRDKAGHPQVGECLPDSFDLRHFAVRSFPERWAPWECARLIGDMFTDKLRFPCPTATMLCLVYPDQEAASARAGYKFMRTTSLSQTKSARFLPKLANQSAEWRHVQSEIQAGKKLVKLFYGLTSYSPLGQGDAHERVIKAIFKAAGWDLADERFLQLQGLVAAFPLSLADGLADDMQRLKRMRTMLSTTAANIAPMQGEYLGRAVPHLLLVGRRGQPFWWSPFENGAGNHNIAICGKSGSGKSVLLQELCAALRGAGAKVVVIDDGRSFEHSVKLQGGRFVEFTLAAGFSLNPFSMVDDARAEADEDYRLDCFAMIKAIVGQMARHGDKPSDTERGLIDRAVTAVWDTLGSGGSIDDIAAALSSGGGELGTNLATAIAPYCRGGSYGGFFSGKASFALDDDFTVFEMSDLASREELRSVVLSAIMFMTGQAMTRTSRATKKLLLIDEAWSMLKGGSMGEFVETFREAMSANAPSKGDSSRLNFDDPDAVNLLRIILRGIGQAESEDETLYRDEVPEGGEGDDASDGNSSSDPPGDQDGGGGQDAPPREPPTYRREEAERQSLDILKAVDCFEAYTTRLVADETPPPRKLTAEVCFILRLMVEACRRPLVVKEGDKKDELFALDLVPKQHDRDRAFAIRVGRILQRLWQGNKSEPSLLSRISIGQHQTEMPFDCFALVALTRWALARSVMAMTSSKQIELAGFVTKGAIAIWKATQAWPRLDPEAELEFVGKLDAALGIKADETDNLLRHYVELNRRFESN